MSARAVRLFLAAAALGPGVAAAQVGAFHFEADRVPVGRVYHYIKSNRDGSRPTHITLYVAATDRLEALKWDSGGEHATLVVAQMAWSRFSVRRLESWVVRGGHPDTLRGTLETDPRGEAIRISFFQDSLIPIGSWPWHSYDFDFASLGLTLPHLKNAEGTFTFARMDITYDGDRLGFRDFGPIHVQFEAHERRGDLLTRRYRMGGPGILDTEGFLWADARDGHIVEFEIPIPDEPGYQDGRLRLEGIGRITLSEWEAYKRAKVGDAVRP
jgi:hypothetical protein